MSEVLIGHCLRDNRNLDMRLLVNGFADKLQHEAGETECHWHDLLLSRLMERAVPAKESRAERLLRFAVPVQVLRVPDLQPCRAGKCRRRQSRRKVRQATKGDGECRTSSARPVGRNTPRASSRPPPAPSARTSANTSRRRARTGSRECAAREDGLLSERPAPWRTDFPAAGGKPKSGRIRGYVRPVSYALTFASDEPLAGPQGTGKDLFTPDYLVELSPSETRLVVPRPTLWV